MYSVYIYNYKDVFSLDNILCYICLLTTYIYIYIYVYCIHIHSFIYTCVFIYITYTCTYTYIWSCLPTARSPPSICKLLAAFLRSSLVFARFLQRFWLPASHLLATCYLLGDLRSTHTPSKYLCATYSHIYMCYVSTSYIYIYWYML